MWAAATDYLARFLQLLHDYLGGSWGWAVIALTVIIRLILHPLNNKQLVSMQKMQKLQPRLKVLQEKYANDKETLSRETMNLYKENKVNPAAGCLPLLVQLPILILLFNVLTKNDYGTSSFLGVTLNGSVESTLAAAVGSVLKPAEIGFTSVAKAIFANPAGLVHVGVYLPNLILLLAIVFVTWYQQKMSGTGNPQMATMNIFMPIFMGFICLGMPGGVMLYWGLSSFIGVAQQWWVIRKIDKEEPPVLLKDKPRSDKPAEPLVKKSAPAKVVRVKPAQHPQDNGDSFIPEDSTSGSKVSQKGDYDDFIPRN